jgi:hypothetical protein
MWYFVLGALLGVVSLIYQNPVAFLQSNHPIQGAIGMAILGAAVYGSVLWTIGNLVF